MGHETARVSCFYKMTEQNQHVLKREVRKNYKKPLQIIYCEFQQAVGVTVHLSTLRKERRTFHIHECVAAHKINYTQSNKAMTHLVFALQHQVLQWSTVATGQWTTVKLLYGTTSHAKCFFRADGRAWVWRMSGESLLLEYIVPSVVKFISSQVSNKYISGGDVLV